jgi:hypothetical protein
MIGSILGLAAGFLFPPAAGWTLASLGTGMAIGGMAGGLLPFQHGGIIAEPTILSSARTGRAYGIMAERGAERISPAGNDNSKSMEVNNYITIDATIYDKDIDSEILGRNIAYHIERTLRRPGLA